MGWLDDSIDAGKRTGRLIVCRGSVEIVRQIDNVVIFFLHRDTPIPRLVAEERSQIVLPFLVLSLPKTGHYRRSIHRDSPISHHIVLVSICHLLPIIRRAVRVLLSVSTIPTNFDFLASWQRERPNSEATRLRASQNTPIHLNLEREDINDIVLIFV